MEELRAYLKEVGAEISMERSPKGLEDDLHKIIGVCDTAFSSEATEAEVEALLNSIVSVLIVVSKLFINLFSRSSFFRLCVDSENRNLMLTLKLISTWDDVI